MNLTARTKSIVRRRLGRPLGRWSRAARFHAGLEPERDRKVFCIGMQRSGTTSFGNFCEHELGLARRGFDISIANEWTRAWMKGDHERIFSSPDFRTGEVFEDDPWWCPGFYEVLAARFPQAKFVLLTRDEDKWFRSLAAHSGGRSPGHTDLHAAIYGRQDDFEALLAVARRLVQAQELAGALARGARRFLQGRLPGPCGGGAGLLRPRGAGAVPRHPPRGPREVPPRRGLPRLPRPRLRRRPRQRHRQPRGGVRVSLPGGEGESRRPSAMDLANRRNMPGI